MRYTTGGCRRLWRRGGNGIPRARSWDIRKSILSVLYKLEEEFWAVLRKGPRPVRKDGEGECKGETESAELQAISLIL